MSQEPANVLDKHGAAALLDLNPRTVTNKAARGELPGFQRTGRKEWYFVREELEAWKRQHTERQPPQQ